MARFVRSKYRENGRSPVSLSIGEQSGYYERIVRYIPSEVVAAYIAATGIVEASDDGKYLTSLVVFSLCVIAVILYVILQTRTRTERWVNLSVTVTAFLVWSYAYGGFWKAVGLHQPEWASLAMVFFTLFSGLVEPAEGSGNEGVI